jgi:hypothetical protein
MPYQRINFALYVTPKAPPPPPKPYQPRTDAGDIGQWKIQMAIQKVLEAPDGQKHNILNTMSFLLGGYVGQGYLSESEAIEALKQAIRHRGNVADFAAADKTIERGVRQGKAKPVPAIETYDNP